jgi:hypothetical protein
MASSPKKLERTAEEPGRWQIRSRPNGFLLCAPGFFLESRKNYYEPFSFRDMRCSSAMQKPVRHKKHQQGGDEGTAGGRRTRSFAIETGTLRKLSMAADSKGTSINALVNALLGEYVEHDLEAENYGHISLSLRVFRDFLMELDESRVIAIAQKLGPTMGEERIIHRSLPMNFNTYIRIIRTLLCGHAKWATCKDSENGKTIMLWHKLGPKWSLFLSEYLKAALPQFVKGEPPKDTIRASEEYVSLKIMD